MTVVSVPQQLVLSADGQRTIAGIERLAQVARRPWPCCANVASGRRSRRWSGRPRRYRSGDQASKADLVVIGRRERYNPRTILGSVSYRVSRHVRVPILLVP